MKKWLIGGAAVLAILLGGLFLAARHYAGQIDPLLREKTVQYLSQRFQAEVTIGRLATRLPLNSPVQLLLTRGRGARALVHVEDIGAPLIAIKTADFEVDVGSLWQGPITIPLVRVTGLNVTVPPKGQRPSLPQSQGAPIAVNLPRVEVADARLTLQPKAAGKAPLIFDIHELALEGAGLGRAMKFDARLTNAKPPGVIRTAGDFGPWQPADPASTPIRGTYTFDKADLSVFKGIAGMLSSQGRYEGPLERLVVDGTTSTPDFRLTLSGNPVPLKTTFHAIVDGTNGNTILSPVEAQLGNTRFRCTGSVARNTAAVGKTVAMDVKLERGVIEDILRLAMKGSKPMLRGAMTLVMKFELPPGRGEVAGRLRVSGTFALQDARFTSAKVQDQIDSLSRRGQGRPQAGSIGEVPSNLAGTFVMEKGLIDFSSLQFTVPGSEVALKGHYNFAAEMMDFHGQLRLDAKVSETQSGWKRWALKPVDPFFARGGAGTLLPIRITGPRSGPSFGLDRARKQ